MSDSNEEMTGMSLNLNQRHSDVVQGNVNDVEIFAHVYFQICVATTIVCLH